MKLTVLPVEIPLVTEELEDIDRRLSTAEQTLFWHHEGTKPPRAGPCLCIRGSLQTGAVRPRGQHRPASHQVPAGPFTTFAPEMQVPNPWARAGVGQAACPRCGKVPPEAH